MSSINPISFFSIHLDQLRKGIKIGGGTGFIYCQAESQKHFLITNYHVITARDPKDPKRLLTGYPDSPDELNWYAIGSLCRHGR